MNVRWRIVQNDANGAVVCVLGWARTRDDAAHITHALNFYKTTFAEWYAYDEHGEMDA